VLAEEPDLVGREARTLRLVAGLDVPTPELIGIDAAGERTDVPALLMSALPGRVEWSPGVDRWLAGLAGLLPAIHALRVPRDAVRRFRPYPQADYSPPPWTRRPDVWRRAVEIFHAPPPDLPVAFVHRDFHPGNVLWRRGGVTGVVDWHAASIGPPCVDVGHSRGNLFGYGLDVADRFTRIWERLTGERYHPWADVVTIVGFLDGLRERPGPDRWRLEEALARAVARYMP
jgi:aminoglycoside phosphotransferase (APT) family kinase protein